MRNIFKRDCFLLFSSTERLDRISFVISLFGIEFVYIFFFSVFFSLFGTDGFFPISAEAFFCVGFLWVLVCSYILSNLAVKRARDIGSNGEICRFMVGVFSTFYFLDASQRVFFTTLFGRNWDLWSPLFNCLSVLLAAGVLTLMLWPGNKGKNKYGMPPEKWHCTGRFGE